MVAGAACESHRNNSCTINTVTGNQKNLLRGLFQKKSSSNEEEEEERYYSPLPFCSLQAIKGNPDWPLGSTFPAVPPSVHKCCRQKHPILQNNKKKKGKVKVWLFKKVPFSALFFFINLFFSFRSNLKCMDEVNYFFIVYLSLFYF